MVDPKYEIFMQGQEDMLRNLQGYRYPNLAHRLRLEKADFERVTAELVVLEPFDRRIFYLGALNGESFL